MTNYVMVRSPEKLIADGYIGYGWSVNFSKYDNADKVIDALIIEYGGVGRKRNQIKTYFGLSKGDIVIVPVGGAIAIARVDGHKRFVPNVKFGSNQIKVTFFKTEQGKLIRIPRSQLLGGLESRLKTRKTISLINEFQVEIDALTAQIQEKGAYFFSSIIEEKKDIAAIQFKSNLLHAIRDKKTRLEAGGYGLEKVVKELMELEGYTAKIQAKNQSSGISDADIIAEKSDTFNTTRIIVQAKHHAGMSNRHGLHQLIEYDDDSAEKWLITTATLSKDDKLFAKENAISIMEGEDFIKWLYEHLDDLSLATKNKLGIIQVPTLIEE